jgi:hypothetical protein
MLIQQGTHPNIGITCNIPILTAGVPSWTAPATYEVDVAGTTNSGLGAAGGAGGTAGSCYRCNLTTNAGDFTAIGDGEIRVIDSASEIIGRIPIQVVNYNPLQP